MAIVGSHPGAVQRGDDAGSLRSEAAASAGRGVVVEGAWYAGDGPNSEVRGVGMGMTWWVG